MLKLLPGALALFLSAVSVQAQAQGPDWPTKPVTIYMGFPAGSGVDVVARILQPSLEKTLGQRLVIDYKAGAGGNVASEVVARAAPDGYTFLLGTAATHGINPALYTKLSFDVEADFTPITTLADIPNVLAINPSVIDAKDVKDFIAQVKAAPGKYSYGSTGNGTGTHLAFAAFVRQAGLDMVHVPYKGGPDATNSLIKGETCCSFPLLQAMLPYAKAGKVRLLGVTTPKRVAAMPDLPTIAEAGLPGYESYTWFGIFGPKNLPPAIAQKMNAALKTALEDPEVKAKLIELGNTPRYETLEQFKATVKEGRAKWAVVVKAAGATVD
ncbi:MAG: tripartite tricarboxylate transporter substrate binding protein [Reyranella sp.]|nr:tripartite tricarboxylate transporter substrate binding protein [Reyranella sp.]